MKKFKASYDTAALGIIIAISMFFTACKKGLPEPSTFSPWQERSSAVPQGRYIIEGSYPDQTNFYAIVYDQAGALLHDITTTHDGGKTWRSHTIAGLEENILYGVAATKANTVHVTAYNYVKGGGNVFRSNDGGVSWQREAANAYLNAPSFPNDIKFFDPENGVILGDVQDGYFEIYTTKNGGDTWNRVPSKNIPPPVGNEYGRAFATDIYMNTIWTMVSEVDANNNLINSRLFQSDDHGYSWYVKNSAMPVTGGDASMKFRNLSVGLYKNNSILYRTTDGGTSWHAVPYSGTWFSFDLDNVPGKPGWWVSTGGGDYAFPDANSAKGFGSSISFDDGDHWNLLDTAVNHTCVDMTSPVHGYSGGFTTTAGNDGVFIYRFPAYNP